MNWRSVGYWVSTSLFCAAMYVAGTLNLIRYEGQVDSITGLGYPVYLLSILGFAKVAGATALLLPRVPLIKEWAYAGFTFDLLGASASHAFVGNGIPLIAAPLAFLMLAFVSYGLRPNSRIIAVNGRAKEVDGTH